MDIQATVGLISTRYSRHLSQGTGKKKKKNTQINKFTIVCTYVQNFYQELLAI